MNYRLTEDPNLVVKLNDDGSETHIYLSEFAPEDEDTLLSQYNRWLTDGNTPLDAIVSNYNPSQFLQQMMASSAFDDWLGNFTSLQQTKLITVATNAKMDADWTVMQSVYDSYKAGAAPSAEAITEWQGYADTNEIPITF